MNPLSDHFVADGPTPLWDRARGWMHRIIEGAGIEPELGYRLHGAFIDAGLPAQLMESDAPMDGGAQMEAHASFAETVCQKRPSADER